MLYQDEAVFQQAGTVIRTWALVGIGIHVLTPPVRKSIKVMGAVRIGAKPQWHSRFVKVFNAETFIEFLSQLVGVLPRNQDPPYHRQRTVSQIAESLGVAQRQGTSH